MTAPLTGDVNVRYRATGVSDVQRGLRLVGAEGAATAQKVGGSMRQIASGVEAIAREGKLTAGAMKGILSQGAEMAFMFGPAGAIVGAIAITGMAIYEHITGNIKAARDEINKFRGDLEKMDYMAAATAQTFRMTGDPRAIRKAGESNADFIARRSGLQGTRSRIEELRGQIPKNILEQIGRGATFFSGNTPAVTAAANEMAELVRNLARLKTEAAEAAPVVGQLAATIVQQTKNTEAQQKQEEAAFDAAVAKRAAEFAAEAARAPKMPGVQYIGSTPTVPLIGGAEGHRAFGLKAANVGEGFKADFVNPLGESIQKSIAEGIGGAISAGFDAAFAQGGNLGAVLGAFGGVALRTIGGVFKDIGMQSLLGLEFMQAIKAAIMTWNPALGIAASIGLIALGSALQAAGSRVGGGGFGGGGAGGGGYSSAPTIIDRGIINPVSSMGAATNLVPRNVVVNNVTIIGPNDPMAQRAWAELQRNSQLRGTV